MKAPVRRSWYWLGMDISIPENPLPIRHTMCADSVRHHSSQVKLLPPSECLVSVAGGVFVHVLQHKQYKCFLVQTHRMGRWADTLINGILSDNVGLIWIEHCIIRLRVTVFPEEPACNILVIDQWLFCCG